MLRPAEHHRRVAPPSAGSSIPRRSIAFCGKTTCYACVRRKFVLTTDSNHPLPVYPNLAREKVLSGLDQLWVARYHLYPAALGVRLPGGDSGSSLAAGGRLGARGHAGREADDRRVADGAAAAAARSGAGASLRPRGAVCRSRLRRLIEAAQDHHQHEPQSEPLRQCQSGVVHEDAEVRRGLPQRVPRSGGSARIDRALSRAGVQREAAAFGLGLLSAGKALPCDLPLSRSSAMR